MILVVDDDPSVTASLALLLRQQGCASESMHAPEAALAAAPNAPSSSGT